MGAVLDRMFVRALGKESCFNAGHLPGDATSSHRVRVLCGQNYIYCGRLASHPWASMPFWLGLCCRFECASSSWVGAQVVVEDFFNTRPPAVTAAGARTGS